MELEGKHVIAADTDRVWTALFDREVPERAILGCESLEWTGETSFAADAAVGGELAAPGSRPVEPAAQILTSEFFASFEQILAEQNATETVEALTE